MRFALNALLAPLAPLALPALVLAAPPGIPMSDFGPSQVSLGLFLEHSGQDLFLDRSPSILNTYGLGLEYAPWPLLSIGAFGGVAELDVDVPDERVDDDSALGFNGGLSFSGGGLLKLATPRFASGTTRFVAYGAAAWFGAEDDFSNRKQGIMTNSGLNVQYQWAGKLNVVLGGEFQAILEGAQENSRGREEPFGMSEPNAQADYVRLLVGLEWYFKGKNKPFVSVAMRPGAYSEWHEHLGLRNASIAVTLGAIATMPGKGKHKDEEEEAGFTPEE